ncbi:MAG TPA: AI-2E family transporter, partial [Saprospiraceae bacterium]|nr:AI-2E family transporter [Saprospiraceae bacterium]
MLKNLTTARHFYTLATLTLVVIAMYFMKPVLAPLCISFILAVILMPAAQYLERKGMGTPWAALAVVILGGLFLIAVIFSIGWQVSNLAENSPGLVQKAQTKIYGLTGALEAKFPQLKGLRLSTQVKQKMNESLKNQGTYISQAIGDVLPILGKALLVPLYVYFMLSYRHFFRKFFHRVIDRENDRIDDVLFKAHDVTQSYLSGLFTVMMIVAGLNFLGLLIFKVPYALFFAVLASVLMIIPY